MTTPAAERGSLTISDRALSHLSEYAARETLATYGRPDYRARVHFKQGGRVAQVRVEVPYPFPAARAADEVSRHVAERLDALADTRVRTVAVGVSYVGASYVAADASQMPATGESADVAAAQAADSIEKQASGSPATRPLPHARQAPAAIAAFLVGSAAALALTAVIEQRYHRTGQLETWAKSIAHARPTNAAVIACAAVLVVVGLVSLVCAFLPAKKHAEMQTGDRRLYASVSPGAIATYLRHAVRDVDMAALVKVRRASTARVRLSVMPADTDTALARARQVEAQAADTFAAPKLRVRARVRVRKARVL